MAIRRRNYEKGTCEVEFECNGRKRVVVAATNDREARKQTKLAKEAEQATQLADRNAVRKAAPDVPLGIDGAFAKYYRERVGREISEPAKGLPDDQIQIRDSLILMRNYFIGMAPPITSLLQITDEKIIALVQWRAAQYRWGKPEHGLVSPTQVNTTTVKRLKAVFTHARKVWKLEFPNEPAWNERFLKQPGQRKRIMRETEQLTLQTELPEWYYKLLEFSIASCLRKSECLIKWADVDMGRRVVNIRIKGGESVDHPLTPKACAIIESCRGDHPTHVFTYVAQRTQTLKNRGRVIKSTTRGERYPITLSGLSAMFWGAKQRAGIIGYKWHDNRRTGASEINRAGNTKLAQTALHHKDIKTTMAYIVVTDEELLAGMTVAEERRGERLAATRQLMAEQEQMRLPAPQGA